MENASREYPYAEIKALVEQQKSKYGWEFIFESRYAERYGVGGRPLN